MTVFMFPGQGVQSKGMGRHLFDQFSRNEKIASEILGYSIRDLCINDPDQRLNNTYYTQPAIFFVNSMYYWDYIEKSKESPNYLLGHSLGEYNALFAADVIDFETALQLVQQRGKLMSQQTDGTMAAIIGINAEEIFKVLNLHELQNTCIANYNSNNQTVISGSNIEINRSEELFDAVGATFVPLAVSGAFHSKYMKNARSAFKKSLQEIKFNAPKIPVISNVNAKLHRQKEIASYLVQHLTCPVKWVQSIEYLIQVGENDFKEIGHGQMLTNLARKIIKERQKSKI